MSTVIAMPKFLGGGKLPKLQTYKFEDGTKTERVITDLEVLGSYCEQAFAELEIEKSVLIDAKNRVVVLEGNVALKEMALEDAQKAFLKAAEARKGVPCRK